MTQARTLRRLILLRHAHAQPQQPGQNDSERSLSPTGEAEADAAGRWLAANGPLPQRVVASPAERARATAERVLTHTGYIDQRVDPRIYEASPGELFEVLSAHTDIEVLMLVGHNPGFESLVALLSTGQSGDHRGMPPGGIAVIDFEADAEIEPGAARLAAFWAP
jgi:phosphohistidine phosphatase SixA